MADIANPLFCSPELSGYSPELIMTGLLSKSSNPLDWHKRHSYLKKADKLSILTLRLFVMAKQACNYAFRGQHERSFPLEAFPVSATPSQRHVFLTVFRPLFEFPRV
jgi:hypothetical protein